MAKKLINLLIESDAESKNLKRLRKIVPVASGFLIAVYVISYLMSLAYIRINLNEYNKIKTQVEAYERKIKASKSSESIYLTTIGVLTKINKILSGDSRIIDNSLPVVYGFQNDNIIIDSVSIDNSGPVSFLVKATSVDVLYDFVNQLKESEGTYKLTDVRASGILRENDGSYSFSVYMKIKPGINANEE